MTAMTPAIDQANTADLAALLALYAASFPDEDLSALVETIVTSDTGATFSLVCRHGGDICGHIGFTLCDSDLGANTRALLAPLAVHPDWQGRGLGKAMVWSGLGQLALMETSDVFVLGDPAYYGRFGFMSDHRVTTPYPLPEAYGNDAWRRFDLGGAQSTETSLRLPAFWMQPQLW